ncbi:MULTISPECIES: hypothetical protein [Xanthomonas]|nr:MULTISPECIES: hypothetical protein [Xanthomonas]MBV6671496.1 hypothetical protein [Xanthomonas euvesicatoria pv. alangii]WPM76181.1 hypothetical protein XVT_18930 [Xanthomonas citri pv. viticola]
MDHHELTEQDHHSRLRVVMAGAEGLLARSQDLIDGMATGYGDTANGR